MCNPTMGGVSASLAMLGDINVAEPNALIGFAGPRVIEQTVREKLPEGFQRAEFLQEKGAVDMIVSRRDMRDELARLIALMLKVDEPVEIVSHDEAHTVASNVEETEEDEAKTTKKTTRTRKKPLRV